MILADFVAFTLWVLAKGGNLGQVMMLFRAPWAMQVALDLVLALSLVSVWLWTDARKRGRNPLPWVIATCITGSIAPLTYLLLRPDGPAEHA